MAIKIDNQPRPRRPLAQRFTNGAASLKPGVGFRVCDTVVKKGLGFGLRIRASAFGRSILQSSSVIGQAIIRLCENTWVFVPFKFVLLMGLSHMFMNPPCALNPRPMPCMLGRVVKVIPWRRRTHPAQDSHLDSHPSTPTHSPVHFLQTKTSKRGLGFMV